METFAVWIQDCKPRAWLHIDVHDWGIKMYKEIIDNLQDFKDALATMGFTEMRGVIAAGDDKLIKFYAMLGMVPIFTLTDEDGEEVYHILSQETS